MDQPAFLTPAVWIVLRIQLWRTHSCVPCWHSCQHVFQRRERVEMSLDAAGPRHAYLKPCEKCGLAKPHCTFRLTTFDATPSATKYTNTVPMPARLLGIVM